jgi:hypothetical protein
MNSLRRAGLAGAIIVLGAVLWKNPLSGEDILDPVVWMILTAIALFGAMLGVAGELAWHNLRESRMWLLWTALCLSVLSGLIVLPFIQATRENTAFLATADSTRGVVESKYYRSGPRLEVTYTTAGQQHRVTRGGDLRYDQWKRGDSVWVYFPAIAPDSARVGRLGPPAAPVLQSLSWLWGIGGLLFLGYVPLVVAFFRLESRKPEATQTHSSIAPDS